MNAVICMLNSQYIHSSLAPWCLAAGIDAYAGGGVSADVVEGTINMDMTELADKIAAYRPRAVAFCCYIWNIACVRQLLPMIARRLPTARILLGGPEVSYAAETYLREEPLVDFILVGEGERPMALLLSALERGENGGGIPGVVRRSADGTIEAEMPEAPPAQPPSPYTPRYFAALNGRIAYLETSRGCPYSCAFCLSGRLGGVRWYSLERAKREMILLAQSGTQTVKLVDRTFNADPKRAYELFRFVLDEQGKGIPHGVCFHFEIAGDLLDDRTLTLLSAAPKGAVQLEIGLQSFNEKTLAAVHRRTDTARLTRNIARLLEPGNIHVHIDLIAGLPLEDMSSFAGSFNAAYALGAHMLQLGFLKLLRGAPMREKPEKYPCRFSSEPPYEVTETPWLTAADLAKLHSAEEAVDRLYGSGRFRRTLAHVLKISGLTPFDLFCAAGEALFAGGERQWGVPLDELTARVYAFFTSLPGVDPTALRDAMVCDRLATNPSGKLPPVLRVEDKALRAAVHRLEDGAATKKNPGVRRGCAALYAKKKLVYADYTDKDPVTGEFPLVFIPMENGCVPEKTGADE